MMKTELHTGSSEVTQVLAAATALEPRIKTAVETMETERCLPPSLVRAMKEAGIFRMAVARAYGGLELPPTDQVRIIEELSRHGAVVVNGSTALSDASAKEEDSRH